MRWMLLFLAAIPGACGFTPLYRDGGGRITAELGSIALQSVTGAETINFELKKELEQFLPQTSDTAYKMDIVLRGRHRSTAVTSLANTIRFNYELNVTYTLEELATGQIFRDNKSILTSYGIVVSEYSSRVAREVAEQKAAKEAAERIKFELVVFLRNKDQASLTKISNKEGADETPDDTDGNALQGAPGSVTGSPLPDRLLTNGPRSDKSGLDSARTDDIERIGDEYQGRE